MTQEEKQLLLKDLCARLPYGVRVLYDNGLICQPSGLTKFDDQTCITAFGVIDPIEIEKVKPYLRPMSDMTEEEITQLCETIHCNLAYSKEDIQNTLRLLDDITIVNNAKAIDYLIAHHLDFRGMIEKGLALPAPKDMYKL